MKKILIDKKELTRLVDEGLTSKEIAAKLNCSATKIIRACHSLQVKLPIVRHARTRSKTFDTRFFKSIDSEDKAYILGFISADGGRDRKWGIKVSIHPKDAELLEKIAKIMKCNYKPAIVENGTRVKLALYDIDMVKDLEQYGIVERKTFTLPFAKNVPERFIPAYLRGMFDGDGSFSKRKGQANFVCGSKPFVDGLLKWAKKTYNYDLYCKNEGSKYRMVIRKSEASLMHDMYKNATISLKRKKVLYEKFWSSNDIV